MHNGLQRYSLIERSPQGASLKPGSRQALPSAAAGMPSRKSAGLSTAAWETDHGTEHSNNRNVERTRRRPAPRRRRNRGIYLRQARRTAEDLLPCRNLASAGLPAWGGAMCQAIGTIALDCRAGKPRVPANDLVGDGSIVRHSNEAVQAVPT